MQLRPSAERTRKLNPNRNAKHTPMISPDGSPVTVRVMQTDEDLMIARHTYRLITDGGTHDIHV